MLARGIGGVPLVDGVQLDKVDVSVMRDLVRELRAIDPRLTIIAAGGIDEANAAAYAATGVDGLATTAPFNRSMWACAWNVLRSRLRVSSSSSR